MKTPSDETLARLVAQAERPQLPGERYELGEKLGAGGMGTVWRARDRELARDVAIKVVRAARDPAVMTERLLAEARTLAALEHPGIPPVYEAGTLADGRAWYAMRFVHGTTLARTPRTSPRAGLRLCLRLCETVAHAHALGVVHLDLKPENVMLGPLGELYVMDWGLARAAGTPTGGSGGGTPGYISPEQETPGACAPDARADVYALGGLVAFLAGGASPVPDGRVALAGLARPLAAIVSRCRTRDPAERYPSALELARDLAAFLDEEPVTAYRENPFERTARFLRRHQFVVWLVAGYLILRALVVFFTGR